MLTRWATQRTSWMLAGVGLVTLISTVIATRLELRMNWIDLLPADQPFIELYRDVQDRFGEASLVVALEGDRDAIVAMAEELEPRLEALESLHNVVGRTPTEFLLDHAYVLLKPEHFERALRTFEDWTLTGALRGINDDYEREYTDSESNLRRDEVDIARNVLGMTRALELLAGAAAGLRGEEAMIEAADALAIGDPWMLALDRRMLLIAMTPQANAFEIDRSIATVEEVEVIIEEVAPRHPLVHASATGMAKIGQDEMNSVGGYTVVLSLVALVLIYLLLARAFGGWVMPLLALAPLVMGILWTMAALEFLFGDLNLFTVMMMLVLLGVGVDFSIHVITRFQEEMHRGAALAEALATMLGTSGVAVIIGALTTALAFFTLMVGETKGVHEFGIAAGLGVLLTLVAILVALPALLTVRHRVRERRGAGEQGRAPGDGSYRWIGRIAAAGWHHPGLFLAGTVLVVAGSIWAMRHTAYEYDFLELEEKGLRSVELQREIPRRFGVSDHGAWLVVQTIEESRELKEAFRQVPEVGEVNAISDFVPSGERLAIYAPELRSFRDEKLRRDRRAWQPGDGQVLAAEVERLWDNLDLMSNLAYTAGLDRIVGVIDQMTGLDSESGETDPRALLPTLTRLLADGVADEAMGPLAEAWAARLKGNLQRMTNPSAIALDELPGSVVRSFMPRIGDGFLMHLVPRRYLWDRASLERFASQTEAVHAEVIGSEKLILVMMDETLQDGAAAALLALVVIAGLLLLHFRGPVGLVALIPLVIGSLIMLGLMYVLGMKYNYMNLIATPIILGIGIDDGVHALHRLREHGSMSGASIIESFQFVGKAIFLTSVTTMIGFGSVAFYAMRGMASFGQVLFLGVGACFLATVLVLPAVMWVVTGQWRESVRKDASYAVR
jgi:predicted RND superfamily exporter protein